MTSSTDSTRETWTAAIRYITGRKEAEEALGFLAYVSSLLDTHTDPDAWGAAVAKVCVPYLGSAASLDVTGGSSPVSAPDEGYAQVFDALRAASRQHGNSTFVISEHEKLDGQVQSRPAGVPAGSVSSAVVVPLRFRGESSGHLVVVRGPNHPKGALGPADLALISELAARVALGNALTVALTGSAREALSGTSTG